MVDTGVPGGSAQAKYERLRAHRQRAIRREHPHIGGLLLRVIDEPQHTKAWATGAAGERRLAERLEELTGPDALFVHDRRIPGSRCNIDHIAIGASGVFVIDAKNYDDAKVIVRRTGSVFRPGPAQLVVRGRDRTEFVSKIKRQLAAVRTAIDDWGQLGDVPVSAILCFIGVYGLGKPLSIDGVTVAGPTSTGKIISSAGPYAAEQREQVQRALAVRLRPAA
jgi:hypothetical protein